MGVEVYLICCDYCQNNSAGKPLLIDVLNMGQRHYPPGYSTPWAWFLPFPPHPHWTLFSQWFLVGWSPEAPISITFTAKVSLHNQLPSLLWPPPVGLACSWAHASLTASSSSVSTPLDSLLSHHPQLLSCLQSPPLLRPISDATVQHQQHNTFRLP